VQGVNALRTPGRLEKKIACWSRHVLSGIVAAWLSEDFQHEQRLVGVQITTPFRIKDIGGLLT